MRIKRKVIAAGIILIALITIIGLSGVNYLIPPSRRINPEAEQARYGAGTEERGYQNMQKVYLKTSDGVNVAADLYTPAEPRGWLVLIHMMPATKESWRDLATAFQNVGYESIAIDLRGHGESTTAESEEGGEKKLDYRNFSDEEHQKSILDLEAAVDYLKKRGATPDRISFIGASIGANLALEYISEHPEFKRAVLLSPGLDYRGIRTEPMVKKLKTGQRVFFASSRDDGSDASENQKLYDLTPLTPITGKDIKIYNAAGHGTTMLEKEPELSQLIINFLQ